MAVVAGRGHDDGDEHAVKRHTEGGDDVGGQHASGDDTRRTSRCPEEGGDECGGVGVGWRTVSRMGDGYAEDLVGDTAGHQHPVNPRGAGRDLLGEGGAHEHIAQVHHQTHRDDLDVGCLGGYEGIDAVFSGRSTRKEAANESDSSCQSRLFGDDAQRECNGKVTQGDGDADANSLNDIPIRYLINRRGYACSGIPGCWDSCPGRLRWSWS